jgi:hypothetical protein
MAYRVKDDRQRYIVIGRAMAHCDQNFIIHLKKSAKCIVGHVFKQSMLCNKQVANM